MIISRVWAMPNKWTFTIKPIRDLLDRYIKVEAEIGHTFKNNQPISDVKKAIDNNYRPESIKDWVM